MCNGNCANCPNKHQHQPKVEKLSEHVFETEIDTEVTPVGSKAVINIDNKKQLLITIKSATEIEIELLEVGD